MSSPLTPFRVFSVFRSPPLGGFVAIQQGHSLLGALAAQQGSGTLANTRATSAWMWRDADGRVWRDYADGRTLIACAAGEQRFEGARRESGGVYYATYSNGTPIPENEISAVVEPLAQNLLTYSDNTSDASWGVSGPIVKTSTNNPGVAGNNAGLFTKTGTGSVTVAHTLASTTVGTIYRFSVYAKAGSINRLQILGGSAGFGLSRWANYELSGAGLLGTAAGASASITQYGAWYRLSIVMAATATASNVPIGVCAISSLTDTRAPSIATTGDFYLDGRQCKIGADESTHIQTTAAAVTRNADTLTLSGYTLPPAGTMYFEASALAWSAPTGQLLGDATNYIMKPIATMSGIEAFDGTNTAQGPAGTPTGRMRYAVRWGNGKMRISANGALGTEANFDGDWNLSALQVANGFNGTVRKLRFWGVPMDDAQLAGVTL